MPRCLTGNSLEGEAGGVLCADRCNGNVTLICQVSPAAKLSMGTLSKYMYLSPAPEDVFVTPEHQRVLPSICVFGTLPLN